MTTYHFDVRVGSDFVEDENGADFPDLAAAEKEARHAVLEMAKYKLLDGLNEISIEVRDGGKVPVLIATASVAIRRDI